MCDKKEIIKQNLEITKIDIHMTNTEIGQFQANIDIYINDLIKINDIHIFESNGKKNITMPYSFDGLFYTFFVSILDKDIYKLLYDEIIKRFDEYCTKFEK